MGEKPPTRLEPVGVTMRHADISGVPIAPSLPPPPLVVRRALAEEAGALAALLGGAFVAETWEPAATERELFCDETVRATLVVAAQKRLAATASLQIRPDVPQCGWVRWVATQSDYQRQGLGRAVVSRVLGVAAQAGCREVRLHTETDRLAAISLYLGLGFEPHIQDDSEREAWARVIRRLDGAAG